MAIERMNPNIHNAVIVSDKDPNIRLRHMFFEPPLAIDTLVQIDDETRPNSLVVDNQENMSKVTYGNHIYTPSQELYEQVQAVAESQGQIIKPFEGLPRTATWQEWQTYLVRRMLKELPLGA